MKLNECDLQEGDSLLLERLDDIDDLMLGWADGNQRTRQ